MFYLSFQLGEKISVNFEFCECKHREPLPSLRSLCWKILCLSGFQENSPLCWTIQGSNTDLDWFLHIELKKAKIYVTRIIDVFSCLFTISVYHNFQDQVPVQWKYWVLTLFLTLEQILTNWHQLAYSIGQKYFPAWKITNINVRMPFFHEYHFIL